MIEFNFWFLYGMALGVVVFDDEDTEAAEVEWGFTVFIGPIALTVTKE